MGVDRVATAECIVRNGKVLTPDGEIVETDVVCLGGIIVDIRRKPAAAGMRIVDARGCLVLPGIVDIHGDAFERQIMPRPGTMFPLGIAMLETDRQLAANGITTAYHGITISWEPGLRSLAEARRIISTLDECEKRLHVDNRIHIRWETFAIDEVPDVIELLGRTKKPILAFNDHTTAMLAKTRKESSLRRAAERAMARPEDYLLLLDARRERESEVHIATSILANIARDKAISAFSHDDSSPEQRSFYRSKGVRTAEFPINWETTADAAQAGDMIVFGAPNVVRGGSHIGAVGATEAISRDMCHVLASDYYYPSPMNAAFSLAEKNILSLGKAWDLISAKPAEVAGLPDRGRIALGMRADLILVPDDQIRPVATLCGGRLAYASF